MISRIFENDNLASKKEAEFDDFWGHVREIRYAHDAAVAKLTGTESVGFRSIITNMISTENNNACLRRSNE